LQKVDNWLIIYTPGGNVNKKDKNDLVQYYKSLRPTDYKNQKLEPREVFYIEIIEAIAGLYLKRQRKFVHQTLVLRSDEVMKLAWRFAGYLEDVLNQIGIFKALTAKNREIFGTPIPLFVKDPEHFSPDNINKQAVSYLVWDFFTETRENLILSPTHDDLQTIAEEIYGYLKTQVKNVPRSSKLKEFITLSGNKDGGFVKRRLIWLGLDSYLFRFSANNYLTGKEKRISTVEDFLMQMNTKLSGFTPLDIFVEMTELDEESKKELQKWEEPYMALYYVEGETGDYWTVKNLINKKDYKVWIDYGAPETADPIKKGIFCLGGIVPWQKEWRWSGEQAIYPSLERQNISQIIEMLKTESPKMIYRYCEESKKKVFEYEKNEHDFFISHFKTNPVTFNSGYTMRDRVKQYQQAFNQLKLEKMPKEERTKYNLKDGAPPMDWPEPLLESPDTAAFYVAGRGINFLTGFREFLRALEKKGQDLTKDDEEAIYGYVTDPAISYQLFHHLKKDYSFESVKCAFRIKEWNEERDMEFLLRRYKGRQYKEKFPDIKLVSIED
jgi:hypothetical protein